MDEDKFRLGNFSGIGGDKNQRELEDLDEVFPQPPAPPVDSPTQGPAAIMTHQNLGRVMEHPTEKISQQNKFRSPLDNQPLLEIDINDILPNEYQPRRVFNEEKLRELADSIREHGIIQPLVVMKREEGGKYEIIVGERRYRASKLAGLQKLPAFVRPAISRQTKLELALIENVQRADLNPIEEGKAYQQLHEEFKLSVNEIGKRVGKNYSTVSNLMRLLRLPAEIQRALVEGEIAEGQARPLLTLETPEEMLQMFQIIKKRGMRVREIESKVQEIKKRKIKVQEMFTPDPFLESLENMLRNKLGTRVMISKKAKGGQIMIEFYSDEELGDIMSKLS